MDPSTGGVMGAEERTNREPGPGEGAEDRGTWSSRGEALTMLRAVKAVAAADGLSEGEARRLREHMADMGVPADVCAEVDDFDPTATTLGEILRDVPRGPAGEAQARRLLAGAVAVAVVDGYSERERAAVREAASLLGLPGRWVEALEASARLGWMIEATGDDAMADVWGELQAALLRV